MRSPDPEQDIGLMRFALLTTSYGLARDFTVLLVPVTTTLQVS